MRNRGKLTTPDLVVLALLMEGEKHGYEVLRELARRDVADWAGVSRPQVYYSLRKLKEVGCTTLTDPQTAKLGPERTVHRITRKGMSALKVSLAQDSWVEQRPPQPFMTWLALSVHLPPRAAAELVAKRRRYLRVQLEKEVATHEQLRKLDGKLVRIGCLMTKLVISQFEGELKWLKTVEESMLSDEG